MIKSYGDQGLHKKTSPHFHPCQGRGQHGLVSKEAAERGFIRVLCRLELREAGRRDWEVYRSFGGGVRRMCA